MDSGPDMLPLGDIHVVPHVMKRKEKRFYEFNNNVLESTFLFMNMLILLAGMAFHSGITEVDGGSHWFLTVMVAAVVVGCALYLIIVLSRELVRSYSFAEREKVSAKIEHTLSNWQQKVFLKRVGRLQQQGRPSGGQIAPDQLASPDEGMQAPIATGAGVAPLDMNIMTPLARSGRTISNLYEVPEPLDVGAAEGNSSVIGINPGSLPSSPSHAPAVSPGAMEEGRRTRARAWGSLKLDPVADDQ